MADIRNQNSIERLVLIIGLLFFIPAILLINRFATSERIAEIYVQGSFIPEYIDSEEWLRDVLQKIVHRVDPDFLIAAVPIIPSKDLVREYPEGQDASRLAKLEKIFSQTISVLKEKYGFEYKLLSEWEIDAIQKRNEFWKKFGDQNDVKLKRELYLTLHEIIDRKIIELGLNENYLQVNAPDFDRYLEIENDFFSRVFPSLIKEVDFITTNEKYLEQIDWIIEQNPQSTFLIIYDATQKYWLIQQLKKRKNVNVIRLINVLK